MRPPHALSGGRDARLGATRDFHHGLPGAIRARFAFHRDPFDRMLVAQARLGGLTLVSRDANVARYDVPIVRA